MAANRPGTGWIVTVSSALVVFWSVSAAAQRSRPRPDRTKRRPAASVPAGLDPAAPGQEPILGPSFLVGTWEAQTRNNAYQIRVSWNAGAGRYEGFLVRQGLISQRVGFSLGELCWIATPTSDPGVLEVSEMWRMGSTRGSARVRWRRGVLHAARSTPAQLLTSTTRFSRVGADGRDGRTTSSMPAPAQPQGDQRRRAERAPSARPRAGQLATVRPGHWTVGLPTADAVVASNRGSSPCDTAARQLAALDVWSELVEDLGGAGHVDMKRADPAAAKVWESYRRAGFELFRHSGPACKLDQYQKSNKFRAQTLSRHLSPQLQQKYLAIRAARARALEPGGVRAAELARRRAGGKSSAAGSVKADDKAAQEAIGLFLMLLLAAGAGQGGGQGINWGPDESTEAMRRADPDATENDNVEGTAAYERRQEEIMEEERRERERRQREEAERAEQERRKQEELHKSGLNY